MTTMISVVGAVESDLIREFVAHYLKMGIERFLIGVHFGRGTEPARAEETLATLGDCVDGGARQVSYGPWREGTNGSIRDALRLLAGRGWHVFADIDEFHYYPELLPDVLKEYHDRGEPTVEGLLFDRVTQTGELAGWDASDGLDKSYPLGGFLTATVVGGDPRKVMAARSGIPLGAGNHWAPGLRLGPAAVPPLPIHHFKWRSGCRHYLVARLVEFNGSQVPAEISMRAECQRTLDHLDAHGGRLDVSADGKVEYVATTLDEMPQGWHERIVPVMNYWWRDRWQQRQAEPVS